MSSPASFSDPWDCQPHFDTRQLADAAYRDRLADYFGGLVERRPRTVPIEALQARIDEIRTSAEEASREVMRQSEGIRRGLAEQWRLYCLTPHRDSELMWSHYGDSHRGVALQYRATGSWAQQASRVEYLKDYPSIDIIETPASKVLLSKSAAWSYEDEFNNELYAGRLVYNRQRFLKDLATGKRQARANPGLEWITTELPELRISMRKLGRRCKPVVSLLTLSVRFYVFCQAIWVADTWGVTNVRGRDDRFTVLGSSALPRKQTLLFRPF